MPYEVSSFGSNKKDSTLEGICVNILGFWSFAEEMGAWFFLMYKRFERVIDRIKLKLPISTWYDKQLHLQLKK